LLIYGFVSLIQAGGPVMTVLGALHLASAQASIMYTPVASIVLMVIESLPTAVLVMYSASEQIDESVLEASRTLGAGRLFLFTRVVWPLSSVLVGVNFAITFVQTVGAFAEPAIVGGPSGEMIGNVIATQLSASVHEQFAIALSLMMLVFSLCVVGGVNALLGLSRAAVSGIPRRGKRSANGVDALTAQDVLPLEGVIR
jgi:ABC-type spermidine/putrescine transport system permease subunit I